MTAGYARSIAADWVAQHGSREDGFPHHLANSLRTDTVIADPTGCIRQLQAQVGLRFAEREWVRRRYIAARETLLEYGHADFYRSLPGLLGCTRLTPTRVEEHLDALGKTFDAAAAVAKTPFPFRSDITAPARPIAIFGSLEMIRSGFHREAVFWIAATFARCLKILAADAPLELFRAHAPAFGELSADIGIASAGDIARRAETVIGFLPRLWAVAEDIMLRNPDITNG